LEECISHLYSYGLQVQWDCISHRQGELTRYGEQKDPIERSRDTETKTKRAVAKARRQKRKQSSDGRPPDDLKRNRKRLKASVGRPRNSRNIAPCARNFVEMKHAIPWSYEYVGVNVTNTCPIDSVLMLLYLMRKFGVLPQDIFSWDYTLTEALNHIDAGRFDEARDVWLMHLLYEFGSHDFDLNGTTWNLMSDSALFTSICELFQLQVQTLFGPCKVKESKKSKKTVLNDSCPYNSYYSEETELATMARQDSHLTVDYASRYDNLQAFFTAEYNSFGKRDNKGNISCNVKCGDEITIYGREHGCNKGKRMKRYNLEILRQYWNLCYTLQTWRIILQVHCSLSTSLRLTNTITCWEVHYYSMVVIIDLSALSMIDTLCMMVLGSAEHQQECGQLWRM